MEYLKEAKRCVIWEEISDESLKPQCEEHTMTERKQGAGPTQKTGVGLVFILLFSALGTMAMAPVATATSNESLGIVGASQPVEDAWFSSFENIEFKYVQEVQATRRMTASVPPDNSTKDTELLALTSFMNEIH